MKPHNGRAGASTSDPQRTGNAGCKIYRTFLRRTQSAWKSYTTPARYARGGLTHTQVPSTILSVPRREGERIEEPPAMAIRFQCILLPTDFSELAAHALPYARGLVEAFGARLHCLHVVDDACQYLSAVGPEGIPLGPPREEFVALGEKRMETFTAENLTDFDPPVVTTVRVGRPFAEIIGYARENEVDLIVMGTHGRGAIAHMLLGSTTEKVVRKSPCAVLTARAEGRDFVMP